MSIGVLVTVQAFIIMANVWFAAGNLVNGWLFMAAAIVILFRTAIGHRK